jgi:NitT/TauT family transport system permease protein
MPSNEYKRYLKKIKVNKVLVSVTQILILLFLIFIWEYLSANNVINSFIYSSPSKIIKTIIDLYNTNNLFNHIIM